MTYDQRWDKRSTTGTTNMAELVVRQGHLRFLWSSRSLPLVICVLCFVHQFLSFRPFLAVILYVLQVTLLITILVFLKTFCITKQNNRMCKLLYNIRTTESAKQQCRKHQYKPVCGCQKATIQHHLHDIAQN